MLPIASAMNNIDELTSISNSMLVLITMTAAERKEVLPYIQVMYPDFKKYYGSSVITTEGLVSKVSEMLVKTATFIKELIEKILKAIYKVLTFWKKDDNSSAKPTPKISPLPTGITQTPLVVKYREMEDELVAYCKQHVIDVDIMGTRLRIVQDIVRHISTVFNDIRMTQRVKEHDPRDIINEFDKIISNYRGEFGISTTEYTLKITAVYNVNGVHKQTIPLNSAWAISAHLIHETPRVTAIHHDRIKLITDLKSTIEVMKKISDVINRTTDNLIKNNRGRYGLGANEFILPEYAQAMSDIRHMLNHCFTCLSIADDQAVWGRYEYGCTSRLLKLDTISDEIALQKKQKTSQS